MNRRSPTWLAGIVIILFSTSVVAFNFSAWDLIGVLRAWDVRAGAAAMTAYLGLCVWASYRGICALEV